MRAGAGTGTAAGLGAATMPPSRSRAGAAAGFLRGSSRADFGVSGVLVLTTTFLLLMSFLVFAANETSVLREELISAGFHNPKFFEDERGIAGYDMLAGYSEPTSNLVTFELMRRNVFLAGSVAVLGYVLFAAWAEAAGVWARGTARPLFMRFVGMVVLVSVFVPAWDAAAVESERLGILLLNPLYTLEPRDGRGGSGGLDGCLPGVYEEGPGGAAGRRDPSARDTRIPYAVSPAADDLTALVAVQNLRFRDAVGESEEMSPCDPRLRVSYVYHKAFWGATDGIEEAQTGAEQAFGMLEGLAERVGSGVFMGMTKVMMLFSLTLVGLVTMTVRELFLALVISLLPLLCVLSFAPRVGSIFSRMLESIVPLLLIPVMTAAVLFTGAGILLDMEDGREAGDSLMTFWIAAMSLLLLATGIPLMMAPVLAGLVGQASGMVGTAVLSGVTGAVSVAHGAGTGAAAGYRDGGGLRGGLLGLGGGLRSGASVGMLQDISVGLGTVPGAGAMGSPFARYAGAVGAGAPSPLGLGAYGAGEEWSGLVGPAGAPSPHAHGLGSGRISAAGESAAPLAPPRMAVSDPPFALAAGRSPLADPAMPGRGAPEIRWKGAENGTKKGGEGSGSGGRGAGRRRGAGGSD